MSSLLCLHLQCVSYVMNKPCLQRWSDIMWWTVKALENVQVIDDEWTMPAALI